MWRLISRLRGMRIRWPKVGYKGSEANTKLSPTPHYLSLTTEEAQFSKRRFTISVEGNIGSGKSTLIKFLSKYRDVEVVAEPVDQWRALHGHNLFQLMYSDPVRWGFTFQSYVQLTMAQNHLRPSTAPVRVMERSIHSARHIFVESMYRSGVMSEVEYRVYCEWYRALCARVDCGLDLVVYLHTAPEVVHERVVRRARPEERHLPLAYFQALHQHYQHWLNSDDPALPAILVITANDDLNVMNEKYEYYANMLSNKHYNVIPS